MYVMVVLTLRDVEINFPFEPYDCQRDYMERVIQCLQEGTNGILESPTGTGKTLCLLCAALAWRETYLAHLQLSMKLQDTRTSGEFCENLQEGLGQAATWNSEENIDPKYAIPKIIYTSRTHSQLSQAVNELKNTIYKPKVCVLGSREQMCIHPGVMKQESNIAKVHLCRSKVSTRSCHYYNSLEANQSNKEFSENILDIEDLVELGNKHSVCPYYLSRGLKNSADIVFMPYNYLLDAKSRSGNNVDISNSVILFDEAHNLERICEEAVSFDLTSFDIASCVEDLDRCLDMVTRMEEEGTLLLNEDSPEGGIEKKEVAYMKGVFLQLEEELHNISSSSSPEGTTKPGSYIFELLQKVKITFDTQGQVIDLLEKCNTFLVANSSALKAKQNSLAKFSDALKVVFKTGSIPLSDANKISKHYKVHIEVQKGSDFKKNQLDVWSMSKATSRSQGYSLGYWCFSPGETMKDLMRCEIRSIILTSGTLSPLSSFKAELQIDIPVQLQNPHVIKEHQMCVGILKAGPDGVPLNSSYQNRSKPEYINSLGNALVNFARIVPDGMLVFFPSYTILNMSSKHWQSNGVWGRINQRKQIFVEPRTKSEFTEAMEGFYEKIRDPANKGAAFFAVCRGKVSEGLDFADMNGRAVVITGLPYPPIYDSKVKLKMGFLDEVKNERTFQGLTGKAWYQQQASRAVNQAVGRVLRHKEDYGAIILCDERFAYANNVTQLPPWVKPYIKKYNNFGELQRHLTQFFRRADQLCDKSYTKVKKPDRSNVSINGTNEPPVSSATSVQPSKSVSEFERTQTSRKRDTIRHDVPNKTPLRIEYEDSRSTASSSSTSSQNDKRHQVKKDKSRGFFDSLQVYETENKRDLSRETLAMKESSAANSCCNSPATEAVTVQTAVKKKLKIVRTKTQSNVNTENDKQESETDEKETNAKKYLLKVLTSLGKEKFVVFSSILKEYKQNNDLDSLLRSLTPLLLTDREYYELFLGFSSYVNHTGQKKLYFQKYKDLTGEEIPEEYEKRKRHTKSNTTSNKKPRTDNL